MVDLRHINSFIRPKLIQLPKIDDLLDTITALKPKFLSCFDLRAGFWQDLRAGFCTGKVKAVDIIYRTRWKTFYVQVSPDGIKRSKRGDA